MFGVGVTKQVSKSCESNRQLSRYAEGVINVCPSCGQENETSKHVTRCQAPKMVEIFKRSINTLLSWTSTTLIEISVIHMIRDYLLGQDNKRMQECTQVYQTRLINLAESQDRLGWDCFVEGRISRVFLRVVEASLSASGSQQTSTNWCQKLVGHLLQITHKQWIFRNSQVHKSCKVTHKRNTILSWTKCAG